MTDISISEKERLLDEHKQSSNQNDETIPQGHPIINKSEDVGNSSQLLMSPGARD